jgi:hypothetical protein
MHFRTSVLDGRTIGAVVAGLVIAHVAQPLWGDRKSTGPFDK